MADLHGVFFPFANDDQALADSRGLQLAQLPGTGFGGDLAIHLYFARWRAMTFGIGGRGIIARARVVPPVTDPTVPALTPTTERFLYAAPELSFNFGSGTGWSYLSGGISKSLWQLVPDGTPHLPADDERLKTVHYGGGARWFAKPHLAFSFDVRFYDVSAGTPFGVLPPSPRAHFLVLGAGVSVK